MNELEPILRFLSVENFDWIVDEQADLLVFDPFSRYSEYGDDPSVGVYMQLLNVDELHEKGLKNSIYSCNFSENFIDDLMFYVGGDEENE